MSYSAQFSQKQPYGEGTKGKFVSSTNKADYCKKCFLETQQGNFKVKWKTMMKDKRYWDANMRDDNFVKQVEHGFKKLYG